MDPKQYRRRSIRLQGYDYSRDGAYFVTICTQRKSCLFGEVTNGKSLLNGAGQMVEIIWRNLPKRFPNVRIEEFAVMPNHVHGIIVLIGALDRRGEPCVRPPVRMGEHKVGEHKVGEHKVRPYDPGCPDSLKSRPTGTQEGTLGRILQAFKSITTHEYIRRVQERQWVPFAGRLWQRNYYEHIVRNEEDLDAIRAYILNNPANWGEDEENPHSPSFRPAAS